MLSFISTTYLSSPYILSHFARITFSLLTHLCIHHHTHHSMSNNVSLHRIIKTNPEKLFRAFTDPLAVAAWMPPHGFLCTVHHLQAHTGGTFRMSFHNFHHWSHPLFRWSIPRGSPCRVSTLYRCFRRPQPPWANHHYHHLAPHFGRHRAHYPSG